MAMTHPSAPSFPGVLHRALGRRIGRLWDVFLEALIGMAELPVDPSVPELRQLTPFPTMPVLVTRYRGLDAASFDGCAE
jgi:hypothetical protein